ncbi:MAG: molybdenum cofactor cytidylyltransferase [Roseiflexaceae bacterium]|nr:molybdenum cofactor cytidylyltransferase [Roseiflexaceae bacterium]
MHITGIILAAGSSARMGHPKQLLDWAGRPLVRVAAEYALATSLNDIIVVTGAAHVAVISALSGLPLRFVHNPQYANGQSTSLRIGIAALPGETDAAMIMLGDQPFVTPEIIEQLIQHWRATNAVIVAPRYQGQRGNPVLFSQSVFAELSAVTGDQGARTLLAARAAEIAIVDIDDQRPLIDIDTPEEYARLIGLAHSLTPGPSPSGRGAAQQG